jgi:hypothetical protein
MGRLPVNRYEMYRAPPGASIYGAAMPRKLYLDFETYYDKDYSLKKMTPVEYVLDPRFEVTGCAVCIDDSKSVFLTEPQFAKLLTQLDPNDTIAVAHNALFDMLILSLRYNFTPVLMVDTMGMARQQVYYKTGSVSLDSVSKHLGLPDKGKMLTKVIGMRAEDIHAAGLWREYADYAVTDVENCRGIYKALRGGVPRDEWVIMDMVLRCAITPRLTIDEDLLAEHLATVQAEKETLLDRVGLDRDTLNSAERFAQALITLGVEPPRKMSVRTGQLTYAFARSDKAFQELADSDDLDVQMLVAARLGIKSTLEETRTQRFLNIARLEWPEHMAGEQWMPIPLKYSGAHTHRFSGDWSLNMQNLPGRKGTKALRRSLKAPKGHVIVSVDASQIEARLNAWISRQLNLLELFRNRGDPYLDFAQRIYGRPLNKQEHGTERFLGKTCILGLGYGMGHIKFKATVELQAREFDIPLEVDTEQCQHIVRMYRQVYNHIAGSWRALDGMISLMAQDTSMQTFGPDGAVMFMHQHIIVPGTGLRIRYNELEHNGAGWRYKFGREWKTLYGGKFLENIIQHLASDVIKKTAVRVRKLTGHRFVHQIHDELLYIVPESEAEAMKQLVVAEMSRPPVYALDAPLAAEGKIGYNYGEMH